MSNYQQFRILKSNACSLVGRPQKGTIQTKKPINFETWFIVCLRKCEKRGAEFTFLCLGLVRIKWPGRPAVLRTLSDFEREYYGEYLSKF